jgi:hypothetical protein
MKVPGLRHVVRVAGNIEALVVGVVGAVWSAFDRWDVLLVLGAWLLGIGVWGQWGKPWAQMVWGALLLSITALHGWSLRRKASR